MTYKVRLANLQDIDWIVKDAGRRMIFEELKKPEFYNPHSIKELALNGVRSGTIVIATKGTESVGVIGGLLVPHYLNTNTVMLAEIMWYVDPKHRAGRAGYLLLKKFSEIGKEKASGTTLSLLGDSQVNDSTLARFGFKLTERNYLSGI